MWKVGTLLIVFLITACKTEYAEPDISLAAYQAEDGFALEVIASEPLIESPVAMEFDNEGRIWVVEKHETEDVLPVIYEEATKRPYPGKSLGQNLVFGRDELYLLKEVCGDDRVHYELARELLDVERQYRTMSRRSGLFNAIDTAISRGFYADEEDATEYARERQKGKQDIETRFAENDVPAL